MQWVPRRRRGTLIPLKHPMTKFSFVFLEPKMSEERSSSLRLGYRDVSKLQSENTNKAMAEHLILIKLPFQTNSNSKPARGRQ